MDASAEGTRSLRASWCSAAAQSALGVIPVPLLVCDSELRVAYANSAAELLAERPGLLQLRLGEIDADFAAAGLEAACGAVLAGSNPAVLPFLQTSSGRAYQVYLAGLPEGGIVALWQPASEPQQLKNQLLEAEERFRQVFDASPAGLVIAGLDGGIVQANEAFAAITGYSKHELVGRTLRSLTYSDDPTIDVSILGNQGGRNVISVRARLLTRTGDPVWVRHTVSVIRDARGEPYRVLGWCEKIDEQYRAEQKLRAGEWRFRSLVESTTDIITIVLPDGTISYISPSVERTLGYRPDEHIGKPVYECVHPDDFPAVRREVSESLTRYGKSVNLEFRIRHKDESWRTMEVTGRNLIHNPVIGGLVLSWRDVTERVRARRRIHEYSSERERQHVELMETLTEGTLSRARMDLLTSIVEEIRTPVIGIGGISDLLLETRLESAQR